MKTLLLLFSLLAFTAQAQVKPHPIDIAYDKCIGKYADDPNFENSPGPIRACEAEALRQWNAELARLVAADKRPAAKAEQAAWVRRRDAQVAALKKQLGYTSEKNASMSALDEIRGKRLELSRMRVLELSKKMP